MWPFSISQLLMSSIILSLIRIFLETHKNEVINISNYDYVTIMWFKSFGFLAKVLSVLSNSLIHLILYGTERHDLGC